MKRFIIGSLMSIVLFAAAAFSQGVASPFTIRLQPFITTGLSSPVFMTNAGDGSNRLFIVQQGGIIRVVQPGTNTMSEFLNITSRVFSGGERGLLGLAFHPEYRDNRRFFVYYTRQTDGAIQIAEYRASTSNPNVADTTEKIIITIPHPGPSNHNGGTVAFGQDGYLYAGPGDGGSGNDPPNNAQNINQLLGKILRIDINNVPVGQVPQYNIPPTNPFAGAIPGADEIFAVGMRNPYRFSFDRGSGQLWAGDVGQNAFEEVDIITRGGNYGWRIYEGNQCTNNDPCVFPANYVAPLFQYSITGARCAITGGYVYRGPLGSFPAGSYVYADYCTGEILLWNNNQQTILLDTNRFISGFGEDEAGEIYVIGLGGSIEKIVRARASADLDGDFLSDISVFRPSNSYWFTRYSSNDTERSQQFGLIGDVPVPEDYDGDNITDLAVFSPANGFWAYLRAGTNTFSTTYFGTNGDIPAPGDFDGDARADFTVYRPSNGTWYSLGSSAGRVTTTQFGLSGDKPVAGDYDGDGRHDIAVFRESNGTWYRINSSNGAFNAVQWGVSGDIPSPGDFDADGKLDHVVFRPSQGNWYRLQSLNAAFVATQWGINNDVPAVGDYNGDGRDDIAVFRPSTGTWWLLPTGGSPSGIQWGQAGDVPIPARDNP